MEDDGYKIYYIPCMCNNHKHDFIVYEDERAENFEILSGNLNETMVINNRLSKLFSTTILFCLSRNDINLKTPTSQKYHFLEKILEKLKNIKFIFFNDIFEIESLFIYRKIASSDDYDQEFIELNKLADILHLTLLRDEDSLPEDYFYYFREYIYRKQIPFLKKIEFILDGGIDIFVERTNENNKPFFCF